MMQTISKVLNGVEVSFVQVGDDLRISAQPISQRVFYGDESCPDEPVTGYSYVVIKEWCDYNNVFLPTEKQWRDAREAGVVGEGTDKRGFRVCLF